MDTQPKKKPSDSRVSAPRDPISRYNLVVKCYNTKCHLQANKKLSVLQSYRLYARLYKLLHPYYLPLLLLMYLLPGVNVLTVLLLAGLWMLYEDGHRGYSKNKKLVGNPLARMVFAPRVCIYFQTTNKFLELGEEECTNLDLTNRRLANGKLLVMFYNEKFRRYYTDYWKGRWVHIAHLLLGIVITCAAVVFLYPLFGLDFLHIVHLDVIC